MNKTDVRAIMKAKRNELTLSEKQIKDNCIFKSIISEDAFINARVIFVYVSFGKEVDTHRIINYALGKGKTVCVPKVINKSGIMKTLKINSLESMCTSNYGILEPDDSAVEIPKTQIDLVLLPGLAFDLNGGRLGYGGGYYDRFLSEVHKNVLKIGLAYEFQIVQKLQTEALDILINGIITERRTKVW